MIVQGHRVVPRRADPAVMQPQTFHWEGPALVALVGPNGAGKTTLARMLTAVADHDGRLTIDGRVPADRSVRGDIAWCPPSPALFVDLSIHSQARYVARMHGADELAPWWWGLADALGMTAALLARRPVGMSAGESQKASLLVSLARPHRMAVLDEPLQGLDEASADGAVEWLCDHRDDRGALLVAATHRQPLVAVADVVHALGAHRRHCGDGSVPPSASSASGEVVLRGRVGSRRGR